MLRSLPPSKTDSNRALILVFSLRSRIRDIFTIGLVQSHFRVIAADSPHLAMIKANQFQPRAVILDITADNTTDILLLSRLRNSGRTRQIPVIVIVPPSIRPMVEKLQQQDREIEAEERGHFEVLEYPFNFSDVLKRLRRSIPATHAAPGSATGSEATGEVPAGDRLSAVLLNPKVAVNDKLITLEGVLQKQWVFPQTVTKALSIIESDSSGTELATCIKSDLSASAAVLKVANTVIYATRGGKRITDILEAVTRLGFRETRNLLACMALIDLSPELYRSTGFSRREFWLHSLATGLIAEQLCIESGGRFAEMAFIAGLIHDLGKVPLDIQLPSLFMHLLEETAEHIVGFAETENALMGFTHAELAGYLTEKWNFPPEICQAVRLHHTPELIMAINRPVERIIAAAVYAANSVVKAIFIGHSCDEIIAEIPRPLLEVLNLQQGVPEAFLRKIFHNLARLCRYLGIPPRELQILRPRKDALTARITVVGDVPHAFHPIVLALQYSGFQVEAVEEFKPHRHPQTRIVIYTSHEGLPIDITLCADELATLPQSDYLTIALLDSMPDKASMPQMLARNLVFLDRRHLDMHYLLHIIDHYLQTVILPNHQTLETLEGMPESPD